MKKAFLLSLFLFAILHAYSLSIVISDQYSNSLTSGNACSGTVLHVISCNGCVSFQWQKNGTNIASATGGSYTVTQSGTYSCIATDANGVTATSNLMQINIVASPPTPKLYTTISGILDDCYDIILLDTSCWFIGALYVLEPYDNSWYADYPNPNGITGVMSGFYRISLYSVCGNTDNNVTIRNKGIFGLYKNRVASKTGKTNLCGSDSIELCVSNDAVTIPTGCSEVQWDSYSWTRDGIPISTSQRIYAKLPGTYKCLISNSCDNGQPQLIDSLVITNFTASASITASGPTNICQGNSVTLSVTPTAGATYSWYKDSVLIPGIFGTSYTVTTAGTYKVEVKYFGCKFMSTDVVVTTFPVPYTPILSSTSPSILCSGGTASLDASPSGSGYSYTWYADGVVVPGASSSTYSPAVQGNYTVKITDAQGCESTSSKMSVVYGTHSASISSSNANPICELKSFTMQSNAVGSDITKYQWKLNGNNIVGANGTTYIQNVTLASAGNYTVDITNACGVFTSPVYALNVNAKPNDPVVTYTGNNFFCTTGTVSLNSITPAGLTYEWLKNGSVISGGTSTTYSATTGGAYSIRHTNASGCTATSNVVDVYTTGFAPVITPSGFAIGCAPFVLSVTPSSGSYTYQWVNSSNYYGPYSTIAGANSSSYAAPVTNYPDNKFYKCIITGPCGTATSNIVEVNIKNSVPTSKILPTSSSGGYIKCDGQVVTLYDNYAPGTIKGIYYQWTKNGVNVNGATSRVYFPTTSGVYRCAVTNGCGTKLSTDSAVITFNTNPAANIIASGSTNLCNGASVTLNANTGTGLTYQWTTNGQEITGAINASYTTSIGGTYRCIVTNNNGCSATSNFINVFTSGTTPTSSITPSGTVNICIGATQTLSANTGNGLSYQWTLNGNNITGANLPTYNANVPGSYAVIVTNSNLCSATSAATIVNIGTITGQISPAGTVNFCAGLNTTLTATTGTGYTYQWYRNNVLLSSTNSSINVGSGGTYKCVITSGSCSTTTNSVVANQINNPTPAITHVTPTTFCAPGSVVLMANNFAGVQYQWQKNSVDILGETSQIYTATSNGSYRVIETANGCSKSKTIAVNAASSVSASIYTNDPTTLCNQGSVTMYVNNPIPGYSYQWKNNGSNISGATATSYTTNASGNYSCNVSASCGNTNSNAIIVSIGSFNAQISPSGNQIICTGGSMLLSASSGIGFTHQWYKNGNVISGATGSTYNATSGGSYTVFISSPCGSGTSPAAVISENTVTASVSPAGTSTVCAGTPFTFTANSGSGYTYRWFRNNVLRPEISQSINVTSAGQYKVEVSINGSCAVISNIAVLDVINNPAPVITPASATICNGAAQVFTANNFTGVTYQWYRNSVLIPGATAQTYSATLAGQYKVIETANSCSKSKSAQLSMVSCREGEVSMAEKQKEMTVAPNPFTEQFSIYIPSEKEGSTNMVVTDVIGKIVYNVAIKLNQTTDINLEIPAGIYFLSVYVDGKYLVQKVVKAQ